MLIAILQVHATVCDDNFANQKTALGCSLAENDLKIEFRHPSVEGDTIFFLFDACHLLKNMRNCLGEYGVLFGSDGLSVKWSFIEGLHDQQLHDNLFLANKLSARHIDFTKKQMSVKLAAETLSTSVADAIEYLREDKKYQSLKAAKQPVNLSAL